MISLFAMSPNNGSSLTKIDIGLVWPVLLFLRFSTTSSFEMSMLIEVVPSQYEISENAKNFIGKLKYSLNVKDHSYSKML